MKLQHIALCFCLFFVQGFLSAQDEEQWKPKGEAKKQLKRILGTWDTESIEKANREIDVKKVFGSVVYDFSVQKKKDKKTKKKRTLYKYKVTMGEADRVFNFKIQGDSIYFPDVAQGWNPCKIIKLEKEEMVLRQVIDGDIHTWNLKRLEATKPKKPKKPKRKG